MLKLSHTHTYKNMWLRSTYVVYMKGLGDSADAIQGVKNCVVNWKKIVINGISVQSVISCFVLNKGKVFNEIFASK